MSGLASNWYRIAPLRPRLRAHAEVHRHTYRGRVWFVLQDHQSGRHFRISPAANLMLCLMDGRRTAEEIWRAAGERLRPERPPQAEMVRLLVQLHQADLLQAGLPPDMAELERRAEKDRRSRTMVWLRNPMAIRFPLLDPDRALDRIVPLVRWVPGRLALLLWVLLLCAGGAVAAAHWAELAANVSDRALTAQNLLVLVLIYPVSKTLHELGHAMAIKLGGGEVHEVGLMLLVFVPVPYVDGSASIAFRGRGERALVAAAGVIVELALAAVAVIAWSVLEPGLLRAVAFNTALLCSLSTLVFNANPLLRFDGYYVLADLIEIPNLDTRAKRYLTYVVQRRVFGLPDVESPVQARGEAVWFACYGIAAFVYRLVVTVGIAALVASKFFVLGILLAAWSLVQMAVLPLWRGLRWVLSGAALRRRRRRAVGVVGGVALAVAALLFAMPMPYAAVADGVVWVPDEAVVRAGADGFVQPLLAQPGSAVAPGTPLFALADPMAAAQVDVLRAQLRVAEGRFEETNLLDRGQARLAQEQVTRARGTLQRAEQRQGDLEVRAARAGRLVVPEAARLPGRFVRKGDLLGYVLGEAEHGVHVVVPQSEVDLARTRTRAVSLRFADDAGRSVPASVVRETPSALDRAPAPGLTAEGGGPMLSDPTSPGRDRPLDRFFEVELRSAEPAGRIGQHVYARFEFPPEPVAWRAIRGIRQLMLRALNG